jgi:heterodisulfide reductase subunit A
VAQGAAASARVLGKIQQREISIEPVRASVNQEQCSGCRICNTLCPYNAISFIEDRGVSQVNAALCQGCGTCVAACPAGAISGTAFSNDQILAQIEGLMMLNIDEPVTA